MEASREDLLDPAVVDGELVTAENPHPRLSHYQRTCPPAGRGALAGAIIFWQNRYLWFVSSLKTCRYCFPVSLLASRSWSPSGAEGERSHFSQDPLAGKYPWKSPYAFSENRVIDAVDSEGMYIFLVIGGEVYQFTEEMIRNTVNSDNVLQKAMSLAMRIPSQENQVGYDNPIRKYLKDPSHDIYFVVTPTNDNHHGVLPNASIFNKGRNGIFEFDQEAFLAYMQEKNPEATFVETRLANFEALNGTDVSRSKGKRHFSMVYLSDQQFGEEPSGSPSLLTVDEVNEKTAPYDGALIIIHETGNHIDERNNPRNPGGVHNTSTPSDWEFYKVDTYFSDFLKKHLPPQQEDDE